MEVPLHSLLGLDLQLYGLSFWAMTHVLVYILISYVDSVAPCICFSFGHRGVPRIM